MNSVPQIMACFGTRPEIIKLAPVIQNLAHDDALAVTTVTTAQHREMLDQMLATFAIIPDRDLDLMRPGQTLVELTARAVTQLHAAMLEQRPDAVLVQGDTTTAMCAALAAFYAGIPVGHVEAGLRTGDVRSPFPEEVNRRLVAPLARWHYCPTGESAANLLREGIDPAAIVVTGNTVIDALLQTAAKPLSPTQQRQLPPKRALRRILVTLHRRETQGAQQAALCRMLARVAERPDVEIIFPVHLSPAVRESVTAELTGGRVRLLEPLDYHVFVHALATSDLIVTDSGGLQEEAPALDIPVLVMRDTTERPEGVRAGCARLCGTTPEQVERDILELLDDLGAYFRMSCAANPYGDGTAAERIVAHLREQLLTPAGGSEGRRLTSASTH